MSEQRSTAPGLSEVEIVATALEHMDRSGGDGYGMPECPWCHSQVHDNHHSGDCELIAAREAVERLRAALHAAKEVELKRLQELASEAARMKHSHAVSFGDINKGTDGHVTAFSDHWGFATCPHPDCVLVHSALHAATAPQEGWQPIETAPKDGHEIIVCAGDCVGAAWWARENTMYPAQWRWSSSGWRAGAINREVTAWMPLPAAPQVAQEG